MCAIFEAWKGKIWTDPRFKGKKMGQNGVKMGQNESISEKKKKKKARLVNLTWLELEYL